MSGVTDLKVDGVQELRKAGRAERLVTAHYRLHAANITTRGRWHVKHWLRCSVLNGSQMAPLFTVQKRLPDGATVYGSETAARWRHCPQFRNNCRIAPLSRNGFQMAPRCTENMSVTTNIDIEK